MEQTFSYKRKNPEYSIQEILTNRRFEERRDEGFSMGLMQLHPHYCVAGGLRALPEDPEIWKALQRRSSAFEVSQDLMHLCAF